MHSGEKSGVWIWGGGLVEGRTSFLLQHSWTLTVGHDGQRDQGPSFVMGRVLRVISSCCDGAYITYSVLEFPYGDNDAPY